MSIEDKLSIIMQAYMPVAVPFGFLFLWFRRLLSGKSPQSTKSQTAGYWRTTLGLLLAGVLAFAGSSVEFPLPPTRYAEGYTRLAFNRIKPGDSREHVYELLGEPLREVTEQRTERIYRGLGLSVHVSDGGSYGAWIVRVDGPAATAKKYRVSPGSHESVLQLPEPDDQREYEVVVLVYSERPYPGTSNFWCREIYLSADRTRVIGKVARFIIDI